MRPFLFLVKFNLCQFIKLSWCVYTSHIYRLPWVFMPIDTILSIKCTSILTLLSFQLYIRQFFSTHVNVCINIFVKIFLFIEQFNKIRFHISVLESPMGFFSFLLCFDSLVFYILQGSKRFINLSCADKNKIYKIYLCLLYKHIQLFSADLWIDI